MFNCLQKPNRRLALLVACVAVGATLAAPIQATAASPPTGHPLEPLLARIDASYQATAAIHDYQCMFIKRERIDGRLTPYEYMFLKIRHEPFSVYLFALGPQRHRGDEAIYVEGAHGNMVIAHTDGLRNRIAGTVTLEPTHTRLMKGNLYPITNIGVKNLLIKLVKLYRYEARFGECDVRNYADTKLGDRITDCVEVLHPQPRRNFRYHITRVFFDRQWNLPIRFEAYSWPDQPTQPPPLIEEYTYTQLKFNQGFGDRDFDPRNPAYHYPD